MIEDNYTAQTEIPKGFIVFNIMRKEFCLDINKVLTIISTKELNHSQLFFDYTNNSIRYHDEIIPAIEFNYNEKSKYSKNYGSKYLILINHNENKIALFVNRIVDYIAVSRAMLNQLKFVPIQTKSLITGKIQYEEKNYLLLDLDQLLEETLKHVPRETYIKK